MRKFYIIFVLATLFSAQSVFADDQEMSSSDSKPCATIADACLKAGFARGDAGDKKFWQNCMKPIILGQTVQGVTIDMNTVTTCRANKIDQLKKELKAFEEASKKSS